MLTKLFTSKATYPNNIVIPLVALRHPAYYKRLYTHLEDFYTDLEVEGSSLDDKSDKDLVEDDSQDGLITDFKAYSR